MAAGRSGRGVVGGAVAEGAVVLGAGVCGLLAALVLAEQSVPVALVERDALPPGTQVRRGVPQGDHPHALLARGRDVLDDLVPGLTGDLVAEGAVPFDAGSGLAAFVGDQRRPPLPEGPAMVGVTRGLLERRLRERVLAHPRVELVAGATATGLLAAGPFRVGGVRLRVGDVERERRAALVVDATGRASRAGTWLRDLGHRPPRELRSDPGVGYAGRLYARPRRWTADWAALSAASVTARRGAVLLPVEGGAWTVGVAGWGGVAPPTDEAGFGAFVASIGVPELTRALRRARPLGPVRVSRSTVNRWYRWDRLPLPPAGLVAVGDAACAVNPVYGQGMTSAALSALVLAEAVEACGSPGSPALPPRVAAGVARAVRVPWRLATGADAFLLAGTPGRRVRLLDRVAADYLRRLDVVAAEDPEVRRTQIEVLQLLAPPSRLVAAPLLRRALAVDGQAPSVLSRTSA